MRPRVEDVDRCLGNALDLLEDSKRCRSAAALALAELSLEQASLASLLWGRLMLDRYGVSAAVGRGEACLPVSPYLPAVVNVLVGELPRFTDQHIMRVATDHSPSLEHLESVLRFIEDLVPFVFDPQRLVGQAYSALPLRTRAWIRLRGKGRYAKVGRTAMSAFLANARGLGIRRLDQLKKDALYARVSRSTGHVELAEVEEELIESVVELSGAVQEMVCRALDAIDSAEAQAKRVQERIKFIRRVELAAGVRVLPPEATP